jgi:methylenetetrahydrofolate reductase (NADPH)
MLDTLRPSRAGAPPINVSFEFFPPKSEEMETALWASIERLAPLNPSFVSVTYGAGGSTRDRTVRITSRILNETGMDAVAHLTCVGSTESELREVLTRYQLAGITNLLALRGDPPGGGGIGGVYQPRADGYANATELTAAISRIGGFDVTVGA